MAKLLSPLISLLSFIIYRRNEYQSLPNLTSWIDRDTTHQSAFGSGVYMAYLQSASDQSEVEELCITVPLDTFCWAGGRHAINECDDTWNDHEKLFC